MVNLPTNKGDANMEKTTETFTFTKVRALDIDTFETVEDEKTFDSDG